MTNLINGKHRKGHKWQQWKSVFGNHDLQTWLYYFIYCDGSLRGLSVHRIDLNLHEVSQCPSI